MPVPNANYKYWNKRRFIKKWIYSRKKYYV